MKRFIPLGVLLITVSAQGTPTKRRNEAVIIGQWKARPVSLALKGSAFMGSDKKSRRASYNWANSIYSSMFIVFEKNHTFYYHAGREPYIGTWWINRTGLVTLTIDYVKTFGDQLPKPKVAERWQLQLNKDTKTLSFQKYIPNPEDDYDFSVKSLIFDKR